MALPLLLAAIPALIQAGTSIAKHYKGKKLAKELKRPDRTTPQASLEAAALTKFAAQGQNRPGSALARRNIATTQAGTTSAVQKAGGSSATTMAAALGAQQQANQATSQQNVLDAQFGQQQQMQYLRALEGLSQQQGANWQWNQSQKFQEEASAARGLQEAGDQGFHGAMGQLGSMAFMSKMGYFDQGQGGGGFFGNMFGGGGNMNQQTIGQIQGNTAANYQQVQNTMGGLQMPQQQWQMPQMNMLSQLQGLPPLPR